MTVRFVDTKLLLYAISQDSDEQAKALSVQVLQEFYLQATRQSRGDALTHEQGVELVESFLRFPAAPVTTEPMLAALATHRRFGNPFRPANG